MRVLLITGLSGAGKSLALKTFEDMGFEAVDNVPLAMLPSLIVSDAPKSHTLAIGADVRGRDFSVEHFRQMLDEVSHDNKHEVQVVFLEADDEVLRCRFSETRRKHPLALDRTVIDGIRSERDILTPLKEYADRIIDTSEFMPGELRNMLREQFGDSQRALFISLVSFSFRHGIPRESDLVFDVRFLKNPYYDSELKNKDGRDAEVGEYIENDTGFAEFFPNLTVMLKPLLPCYLEEGKSYLTIAVGCTGGRHRSVYTTEKLAGFLSSIGYKVAVRHRELGKSPG